MTPNPPPAVEREQQPAERVAEIRARRTNGSGTSAVNVAGVTLACMDADARDLMDRALEAWRAYYVEHERTLAQMWGQCEEGSVWESAGADRVYLFAYWLFRWSGLVDAHAPGDVDWLLEQLDEAPDPEETARYHWLSAQVHRIRCRLDVLGVDDRRAGKALTTQERVEIVLAERDELRQERDRLQAENAALRKQVPQPPPEFEAEGWSYAEA